MRGSFGKMEEGRRMMGDRFVVTACCGGRYGGEGVSSWERMGGEGGGEGPDIIENHLKRPSYSQRRNSPPSLHYSFQTTNPLASPHHPVTQPIPISTPSPGLPHGNHVPPLPHPTWVISGGHPRCARAPTSMRCCDEVRGPLFWSTYRFC